MLVMSLFHYKNCNSNFCSDKMVCQNPQPGFESRLFRLKRFENRTKNEGLNFIRR